MKAAVRSIITFELSSGFMLALKIYFWRDLTKCSRRLAISIIPRASLIWNIYRKDSLKNIKRSISKFEPRCFNAFEQEE